MYPFKNNQVPALQLGYSVKLLMNSLATRTSVLFVIIFCLFSGVLGSDALAQANLRGQWTTLPYTMPINPIHVALLNTGKVLIVSGSGNVQGVTKFQAGVWDPQAGTITTQIVPWDMFCNGMVVLPDGRVMINGGTLKYYPFYGLKKTSLYDPSTNSFTDVQNTAHGRWYPTLTVLGDGRVMSFSGFDETGSTNSTVEIYTVGAGWSTEYTAPFTPPLYPRMHLLPNGLVFNSGPSAGSNLFDPSTHLWISNIASTQYGGTRTYGSSVLLPLSPDNNYNPKVMILGGDNPATLTTEIIDLGAPTPAWQFGPSMSQPRIEMDAVMLPNGKVLAVGGSYNDEDASTASLNADLYDPVSNTFSSAGANVYPRLYHTVSLLLPDGTVWLAGGNPDNTYEKHMEIYQPAYLFTTDINGNPIAATRPTIASAPANLNWDRSFTVQTPDANNISSVVVMRNGSSTHAFDMDARLINLAFTKGAGSLTVTAPPTGNIAPPGYYMLFLLNSSGVPSIAKFVQMGANDFWLAATPASQTVFQGNSTSYAVTLASSGGFTGTSTLSVSGLPAGATGTFAPATVTGSGSSTLTIDTLGSTAPGTYPLTITATAGSVVHTADVTLVVAVLPPPGQLAIDMVVSGDNTAVSASVSTKVFSTSVANELLLAFVSSDSGNAGGMTVTSVTGGGLTWALGKRANTQPGDAEIWRAYATSALTNVTVAANLATSVAASISVVTFTGANPSGANGSGAIGATASTSASSGAPAASLVTTRNNSWVFGVGTDWDRAAARIVGLNQTMVHQFMPSVGSTYWVQRQNNPTPLSGTTVTINDTAPTNDKFNLSIVEVLSGGGSSSPDFSIVSTPTSETVNAGLSTGYTATITSQAGFSGVVNFSVSGLPTGASGVFSPTTVTGSGSSTLTVSTLSSTTPGTYPFSITATSGSLTHTANVTLVVVGPANFTVSATPSLVTVNPGSNASYNVAITGQNGFSGTVNFNVSGLPAGATGAFVPTTGTGSGSTTLSITTVGSVTPGSYPLTITATSGTLSHTANVTLGVAGAADFAIGATPSSRTVVAGTGTTYAVTITGQSGFSGVVTLGVGGLPAGASGTFSPTTITGSGSSTLTINTLSSTPAGTSTLTITGVSGSLNHPTTVSLVVTTPPPPASLAIDTFTSTDRTSAGTTVTSPAFSTTAPNELLLAFVSSDSGLSGGMTVSSVTGGGLTWALVKRTNAQPGDAEIWGAFSTTTLSNATVTANLSQNAVASITVVSFTGADTTGTNGSGAIGATGGASAATGTPTASLVTTRNNSWVFGIGTDWDAAVARTLGTNQTMVHQFLTNVGSTYWVQRQNSVTPLSGTTVTINDTAPSNDKYDLSLVEILPAALGAPDFSFSATPSSQTVVQASSTTYTVTVGGSGGFSGTVNLSVSGLPTGATGTFNPTTITGSGSSTLTVNTLSSTPASTSTLTITGMSGSLSHSTTVSLVVTAPIPPGQLAIDAVTSTDRTSADVSVTSPAFSTTVPNELLLAFVSSDSGISGGMTVSSVTGGGLTWTLVKRTNAQPGDAEIWQAFATTALSNATVTANLSQTVVASITVVILKGTDTSGTNGSGAIGATGGASAATGAPTASLVTTRNNSLVLGVGTDWDAAVARTLGPNQSLVHQFLTNVGSTYWVQRQNNVTPLSGTTVTINDTAPTSDKYDLSLVEILQAP
jgi:Domain of unknown function (DUF1929)